MCALPKLDGEISVQGQTQYTHRHVPECCWLIRKEFAYEISCQACNAHIDYDVPPKCSGNFYFFVLNDRRTRDCINQRPDLISKTMSIVIMKMFACRCDHLLSENKFLRQQLDDSHRANACLTNDLQKLTGDWEHLRDEMSTKEDEWKEEERVSIHNSICWSNFHSYYYRYNCRRSTTTTITNKIAF